MEKFTNQGTNSATTEDWVAVMKYNGVELNQAEVLTPYAIREHGDNSEGIPELVSSFNR